MAFKLIWSPSARFDINDIVFYIAEENPSAAKKFVKTLFETVERLGDFPESGRIVPEFGDDSIREIIRRPFRIVYLLNKSRRTVEIIRVWHSARGTPVI